MKYSSTEHTSDATTEFTEESSVADGDLIAAVDLGSNSFHAVIARNNNGTIVVVDRIKDMVRLAEGLDKEGRIAPDVQARALASLRLIGDRLSTIPTTHVRAVGTNTLRLCSDDHSFLMRAEEALGHRIQVISGYEEARLIFLGVAHDIGKLAGEDRLLIDIGGGSTEFVIGREFDAEFSDSKSMGCVTYTRKFFKDGKITKDAFEKAEVAAQKGLQDISNHMRQMGWDLVVGASGTIRAVADAIRENRLGEGGITLERMRELRKMLIGMGDIRNITLPGVSERRCPVFIGGLAILIGAFKSLKIDSMIVSDGALREGLLYDLIGRMENADRRDQTIDEMAERYEVDREQAKRVRSTAFTIYQQIAEKWGLDKDTLFLKMLNWAAEIHEIGLVMSHNKYQRHGAYIVENSDMSGFSREDQRFLWALLLSHKGEPRKERFDELDKAYKTEAERISIILRLAVILCRSREESVIPEFEINVVGRGLREITLKFPNNFLYEHPLLGADLEEESENLEEIGFELKYS